MWGGRAPQMCVCVSERAGEVRKKCGFHARRSRGIVIAMRRRACLRIHLCAHAISRAIACDGDDEDDKTQTEKKLEEGGGRQRRLTRPCSQKGGPLSPLIGVGGPPGTPMGEEGVGERKSFRHQLGRKWKRFRGRLPKERIQEIRGGKKEKKAVPSAIFALGILWPFTLGWLCTFPAGE